MAGNADTLAGFALFADGLADALELAGHLFVGGDDLVEVVGDLAGEAGPGAGEAHAEVAIFHGLQAHQNDGEVVGHRGIGAVGGRSFWWIFRLGRGLGRCRH
jgi:hypothetical protein